MPKKNYDENQISLFDHDREVAQPLAARMRPEDLSEYRLIVHCGGCMINEREMQSRIHRAGEAGVPIINYGISIAHMHGILKRSLSPFPEIRELLKS